MKASAATFPPGCPPITANYCWETEVVGGRVSVWGRGENANVATGLWCYARRLPQLNSPHDLAWHPTRNPTGGLKDEDAEDKYGPYLMFECRRINGDGNQFFALH